MCIRDRLIAEAAKFIFKRHEIAEHAASQNLYGDGRAGERIVSLLGELKARGELRYPETRPPSPPF